MAKNEVMLQTDFGDILNIIEAAKENAYRAVNRELIDMYWRIGEYVSTKVKNGVWGKNIVSKIADFLQSHHTGNTGFSASNIWRMKQYYETYKDNPILATLSRELSWSINTRIISCKTEEEREFYLRLASKSKYTYRELLRQINSSLFERTMISSKTNINALLIDKYEGLSALRDSYVLEFLDMPKDYKEKDLRKAIVSNLKDFILEFGKDFTFVGEEYRVQVGDTDFFIDLVFYNRELNCLVAVELKREDFKPDHIGQMQFYLAALDNDIKKKNENPSVGLILCSSKNNMIVEYALQKSLAPSLVAAYEFVLPKKELLQQKLTEIKMLTEN